MGIDVYLKWDGMTEEEKQAQYTGFSIVAGKVGYLREAYHGEPYATRVLFGDEDKGNGEEFSIPNKTLKERLPELVKAVKERHLNIYKEGPRKTIVKQAVQSYIDFVELHGKMEKAGKNPIIYVSG